jgi:hypothetical protein
MMAAWTFRVRPLAPQAPVPTPWSLPGGQDHYFKAISELDAGGGFSGEEVAEVGKESDTNFLDAH